MLFMVVFDCLRFLKPDACGPASAVVAAQIANLRAWKLPAGLSMARRNRM
jgi:hypothetical protein